MRDTEGVGDKVMMRFLQSLRILLVMVLCGTAIAVTAAPDSCQPAAAPADGARANPIQPGIATATELKIDPIIFFQKLVDRYRGLYLYKDIINVVHVTQREGQEPSRVETRLACEVADGALKVRTPGSQARQGLGLDVPMKQSQTAKDAQRKYDLWLAPHMALKFTENPLKDMRAGVERGFTATEAESVTIDNKRMVHVELRSGCTGEGASEDCTAKVDLYVNSDSMLIERIETEQQLPDGANYSTTLHITPEQAESEIPSAEPAPVPATEQSLEPAT